MDPLNDISMADYDAEPCGSEEDVNVSTRGPVTQPAPTTPANVSCEERRPKSAGAAVAASRFTTLARQAKQKARPTTTSARQRRKLHQLRKFEHLLPQEHRERFTDLVGDIADQLQISRLTADSHKRSLLLERRRSDKLARATRQYELALSEYDAALELVQSRHRALAATSGPPLVMLQPAPQQQQHTHMHQHREVNDSGQHPQHLSQLLHQGGQLATLASESSKSRDPLFPAEAAAVQSSAGSMFAEVSPPPARATTHGYGGGGTAGPARAGPAGPATTEDSPPPPPPPPPAVGVVGVSVTATAQRPSPPPVATPKAHRDPLRAVTPAQVRQPVMPKQQKPNNSSSNNNDKKKKKSTRQRVAEELLETERGYVDNLNFLMSEYVHPSRKTPPHAAFHGVAADKLFGNVEHIVKLNGEFLEKLEGLMRTWDDDATALGGLISAFAGFFRSYAEYAAQHGNATFLFSAWMKSKPRFRRFIRQVRSHVVCSTTSLVVVVRLIGRPWFGRHQKKKCRFVCPSPSVRPVTHPKVVGLLDGDFKQGAARTTQCMQCHFVCARNFISLCRSAGARQQCAAPCVGVFVDHARAARPEVPTVAGDPGEEDACRPCGSPPAASGVGKDARHCRVH